MNLLTASETLDSEAMQQIASNGGGIPIVVIVLVFIGLVIVLLVLLQILSNRKKAESRPVSQQEQKKQEKIRQEKEKKKQKHEEKRFMEKPSGLPADNMLGKKAKKKAVEPEVKEASAPVEIKEEQPVEPVTEGPKEEVAADNGAKDAFDAIRAAVVNGTCSARSYEPGDKVTLKFSYGLATELDVAIRLELFSLKDKLSNMQCSYNGNTIIVKADCLAPLSLAALQAKPIIDKASVLAGNPEIILNLYLEQVVR